MASTQSLVQVQAFGVGALNPIRWLGTGISEATTDAWRGAMVALWSAGLWVLQVAFRIIDAFTTPDLSQTGPLAQVLPVTFGIGAVVASLIAFVQIGTALFRRDGASLGRVLVGLTQFGAVWAGYLGIAATLVTATAGLTTGLLQSLLHVPAFSGFAASGSWPRQVTDTTTATVLGLCTVFLIFPAAIGYVMIMLVREVALMVLAATSPIAAAGLLGESTRAWFWKSLRWFLASLLITPVAALVLGIGVKATQGTITHSPGDSTTAAVGMAVVGCVLVLLGALCPLVLFRLLAFVDPGTASGAAMRQSLAASGGVTGLIGGLGNPGGSPASALTGGGAGSGSGAATGQDSAGQSQGEASSQAATQSRFASMLGPLGQAGGAGAQVLGSVGSKAASIGSDVLGSAGVGHQAPYLGPADPDPNQQAGTGQTPSSDGGHGDGASPDAAGALHLPTPMPPQPGGSPAAAGSGAAGESSLPALVAEVPIVPL